MDLGDQAWERFAASHPGHRHLAHDPLYSLPERLVDCLLSEIPGLFDRGDEAFERELARATGGGLFSRGHVIPCLLLDQPVDAGRERRDRRIRDALAEYLEAEGVERGRLDEFDRVQAQHDERAHRRAAAYAGWLVSTPRFLAERDHCREGEEGAYVAERGRFPSLPRSYLGEPDNATDPREARLHLFYRRWNIETFLTWDLPLPLLPEVGIVTLDSFALAGAGITLFLPWYVAQDGRFSPDELADHLRSLNRPAHLEGWLATPAGSGKALGDVRYRHHLALYRYWGLVLERRYGDRLRKRTMKIEQAFADFLGCSTDTLKKVRLGVRRAAEAGPGL